MKRLFIFVILLASILLYSRIVEVSEREGVFSDESSSAETIIEFGLDQYEIEDIERGEDTFYKISCENAGEFALEGMPDLPCFSTLVAVPDHGRISFEVLNNEQEILSDICIYPRQQLQSESVPPNRQFYIEEDYYNSGSIFPANAVDLGEAAILRDHRVVRLTVNPFQYDPLNREVIFNREMRVKITADNSVGINEKNINKLPSRAFSALYSGTIINYESAIREDEYQKPACLYIYADENQVLQNLEYILDWRREQGFEVTAVSTSVTGNNSGSIKNYIQDAYDEWDNPPEYVNLVGDANGDYYIPCFWEDSGETDNDFVCLAGNDILPDAVIGRIPFNSISEFQNIISKVINYETNPYMGNTNWFERGLMVGDPSTSGTSCVDSKIYVTGIMAEHAPDVEAIEVYSGGFASQISSNLNEGCVYFNYRGFGDLSGWSNSATDNLINGAMLPCVVFLTCGTGSYASFYDSISEHFLKVGTSSNPKGAVAAISTATNSTHTTFNNVMDVGIWTGVFLDETWNMGMGLTRGKLAMYLNFPNNPSNHQHQFIAWNNLMGDAVMKVWSGVPEDLIVEYPEEIDIDQETFTVMVNDPSGDPVSGALVTLLDEDNSSFSIYTDESGAGNLETTELSEGTLKLTITKHDFVPVREEIEMTSDAGWLEAEMIIDDATGNNDGLINPGEEFEISIELSNNFNTELTGVSMSIVSSLDGFELDDDEMVFSDITAGESAICISPVSGSLADNVTGIEDVILYLSVASDNGEWLLEIDEDVTAPSLYLSEYEIDVAGIFEPGDDADLVVYLSNTGTQEAGNLNISLSSTDDRLSISQGESFLGQIPVGYTGNNLANPFHIFAEEGIIPGTQVTLSIEIDTPEVDHPPVSFIITIGETGEDDPIGPDSYGYYCYDESDIGYIDCPEYNWQEIDPDNGGNGTILPLTDNGNTGNVTTIDLPIEFSFYGEIYDEISVCTNGWIAPGETDARDFMNYTIPGPCGPSPMIAAYWDDIQTGSGNICYYHNTMENTFIVEWSEVENDWDESEQTFEIILYDRNQYPTSSGDSQIKFQYQEFSNPDQGSYGGFYVYHGQFVTIGIEDHTSLRGIEYTYNNEYAPQAPELSDESALMFSTAPINQDSAYLVLYEDEIIDSSNDGRIDYGDDVEVKISISNLGSETAVNVSAQASLNDPYIELTIDQIDYPDISGGGNLFPEAGFEFSVSEDCPDQHSVMMPVLISYNGTEIERHYNITVNAPLISGNVFYIMNDDNENNLIDPGENFHLVLEIDNLGGAPLYEPVFNITSLNPELNINESVNQLISLPNDSNSYMVFASEASELLDPGEEMPVVLMLTGAMGQEVELVYELTASVMEEGFETGDFELLPWATGGASGFSISTQSHSGDYSARSGDIDHQQFTWLGLEISVMVEGEVSFWMEVSTEYGYDYVSFYIDDQEMGSWSGEVDWFESSYELSAGDHELRWEYEKDFMVESGSDCFWLDDIVLPGISGNLPEVLISDSACLDFELSEGETGTDVIEVWNISNELAQYEIRISGDSHDWLEVVPDEGFIPPGESVDLTVIADPEGYGSGMYEALIAVSDNFGNDMSIIANLEYSSNPSQNEDIFTVSSYNGNYPNPFNPQTTFAFQLAQDQYVDLDIYNLKGQKVRSLVNTILMAGKHQVIWKGRNDEGRMMASGVYLVKVKCEDFESHSRILMLK